MPKREACLLDAPIEALEWRERWNWRTAFLELAHLSAEDALVERAKIIQKRSTDSSGVSISFRPTCLNIARESIYCPTTRACPNMVARLQQDHVAAVGESIRQDSTPTGHRYLQAAREAQNQFPPATRTALSTIKTRVMSEWLGPILKNPKHEGSPCFIYGGKGTGKSFLCLGVRQHCEKHHVTVAYYEGEMLLKKLAASNDPASDESENEILDRLYLADLLILDDADKINRTPYKSTTFYNLINLRYENLKPVLLACNASLDQIAAWGDPWDAVADRFKSGPQIYFGHNSLRTWDKKENKAALDSQKTGEAKTK